MASKPTSHTVEVKAREEKYRGKDVSYLKTLPVREFAQYLPSRSRRSVLRHFEVIEKFLKRCDDKARKKKKIKTHMRELVIVPQMVGKPIGIHDGKTFQEVTITSEMIGHRLGEFALTRKRVVHSEAGIGATKGSRALKK
jgi:small subunit ribosomal protein S19